NPLTGADIDGLGGKTPRSPKGEGTRGKPAGCPSQQGAKPPEKDKEGQQQKQIPQKLAEKAARELKSLPPNKQPRVVTIVRDKRTGKIYEGKSGGDLHPDEAHEKLGMPKESLMPDGRSPGKCAEPKAINAALNDGARKSDLQVATVSVADSKPYECCAN